jgi:hypothetical protein
LAAGPYTGLARVNKHPGGSATLYFVFNLDDSECRPGESADWPPPLPPDVCMQEVILLDGVFNGKTKDAEFINARAVFHDLRYWDPDNDENWYYETTTITTVDFKPFSE